MLSDLSHVVVNGYFPSLTVKHVSSFMANSYLTLKVESETLHAYLGWSYGQ